MLCSFILHLWIAYCWEYNILYLSETSSQRSGLSLCRVYASQQRKLSTLSDVINPYPHIRRKMRGRNQPPQKRHVFLGCVCPLAGDKKFHPRFFLGCSKPFGFVLAPFFRSPKHHRRVLRWEKLPPPFPLFCFIKGCAFGVIRWCPWEKSEPIKQPLVIFFDLCFFRCDLGMVQLDLPWQKMIQ